MFSSITTHRFSISNYHAPRCAPPRPPADSRVLAWESVPRSVCVWVGFLCVTYCFQLYMVPAFLLLAVVARWLVSPRPDGSAGRLSSG